MGAARTLSPFGATAADVFASHVCAHLCGLGVETQAAGSTAELVAGALARSGLAAAPQVRWMLGRLGIRRVWNGALAGARAEALAVAIAPWAEARIIDLLAGDGGLGRCLARRLGRPVDGVERHADYPGIASATPPVIDLDVHLASGSRAHKQWETALVVTVLHHEENPEALIKIAVRAARRRIVVVENCISNGEPHAYQQLMDLFFNQVLNQTSLRSPARHRSEAGWKRLFARHGRIVGSVILPEVPGVPLSHTLIAVDLPQ